MKLVGNCSSCKEQIAIKSYASTRPDLEMERGSEFVVNCKKCGTNTQLHVNDVRAVINILLMIGSIVISIVVTLFLLIIGGLIGTLTLAIPLLIWQQQGNSVNTFNAYLSRR